MTVFEKITAQQGKDKESNLWLMGEQLKEICEREPRAAELVAQDLDIPEMSLANCEKKLKLANGDATKFTVYFEDFQSCFNKLSGLVTKIEMGDADKAAKLKGALKAVLASMQERV